MNHKIGHALTVSLLGSEECESPIKNGVAIVKFFLECSNAAASPSSCENRISCCNPSLHASAEDFSQALLEIGLLGSQKIILKIRGVIV